MHLTAANQAIRAVNVTASEVGALMGEHPYRTPAQIFDRITGRVEDVTPPSESMAFGSAVEPILVRMAERALVGIDILNPAPVLRQNPITYQHRRVRLCATPDALILDTRYLVELKLSFSQNRWRDGLPKDIEWQARAQMACTRRERVYVYVFTGVGKLYVVDRHHGKERLLTQAVERFFRDHIDTGIRPADPTPTEIVYRRRSA